MAVAEDKQISYWIRLASGGYDRCEVLRNGPFRLSPLGNGADNSNAQQNPKIQIYQHGLIKN